MLIMTSIHLNDIALPKKFEKLPLSYYINVKSESEFSKNFSKIFFFIVISQTYPKMVLRNAILQKFCHHKNDSKPFPSLIGSLGLNLLNVAVVVVLKVAYSQITPHSDYYYFGIQCQGMLLLRAILNELS